MFKLTQEIKDRIIEIMASEPNAVISVSDASGNDGQFPGAVYIGIGERVPKLIAVLRMPGLTVENIRDHFPDVFAAIETEMIPKIKLPRYVKLYPANSKGIGAISLPFNRLITQELKDNVPSLSWDVGESVWRFKEASRPQVEAVIAKYFQQPTHKVRLTWRNFDAPNITINGFDLCHVARDSWAWDKRQPLSFAVREVDVSSGGSRNHPCIYGDLVIDMELAENAVISPDPFSVEVL